MPDIEGAFGLTVAAEELFPNRPLAPIKDGFRKRLKESYSLGSLMNTEKARSELMIAPILIELWQMSGKQISVYSGVDFNVDPSRGLNGCCDFLLGRGPQLSYVTHPLLAVVEAKNESIPTGLGQCAAEMVAAMEYNQRKEPSATLVFGCVSTGDEWRFLRLQDQKLTMDRQQYQIAEIEVIMGILCSIVGVTPTIEY